MDKSIESITPYIPEQNSDLIIDDDVWTEGFNNLRTINAKSGRIALGTEWGKAFFSHNNEDALFIDLKHDAFAVADGIGGYEKGEIAARIVTKEIKLGLSLGKTPEEMQYRAHLIMLDNGVKEGGACYVAGQITGKKLKVWYAGDCVLFLIDRNGEIKYKTETTPLEDAPRGVGRGQTKTIIESLMNYDRIIVASDGLTQNVHTQEVVDVINGQPVDDAVKQLANLAKQRMVHGFDDGVSYGNKDDLTILVYEILPVPLVKQI